MKWKYEPKPEPAAQGVACCDVVNRGAAYSNGRIYFNTLDNNTIAVDAETGKELWRTKLGDINRGETITMAPLVVKDKVLVGNSGGEYRRARLAHCSRCHDRKAGLEGLQHRARRRCADRSRFQAVLRQRQGQGSRRQYLAARCLAAWAAAQCGDGSPTIPNST